MKTTIFTEEEYKKIMLSACNQPQTEDQIYAVIHECERMRTDSEILNAILDDKLFMYQKDGEFHIGVPK